MSDFMGYFTVFIIYKNWHRTVKVQKESVHTTLPKLRSLSGEKRRQCFDLTIQAEQAEGIDNQKTTIEKLHRFASLNG